MMRTQTLRFLLLPFLLVFLHQASSAQIVHELKSDLLAFRGFDPDISWEINTQKRWTFSIGARYTFTTRSISNGINSFNSPTISFTRWRFRWQYFSFSPAVRFYFSKKNKNYGLFTGLSNTTEINTYLDPTYYQFYKEQNQIEAGDYRLNDFFVGIPLGYKWLLLKDKLVLEVAYTLGFSLGWWYEYPQGGGSGELWLKVGYRFPTKEKEE